MERPDKQPSQRSAATIPLYEPRKILMSIYILMLCIPSTAFESQAMVEIHVYTNRSSPKATTQLQK